MVSAGIGGSLLSACGDSPAATSRPTATIPPATLPPTPVTTAATTPVTTVTTAGSTPAASLAPSATSVPKATPAPRPVTFAVYGDIRTAGIKPPPIFNKLLEVSKGQKPEAALIMGDLINADDNNAVVRQQWAAFKEAFQPLGNVPLLPTIGNHETNYRKDATPLYLEAFPELPKNGPAEFQGFVYSLDIGLVHLVCLASELPSQPHRFGKTQLDWLAQDLKVNRLPYTLVFSHDPGYPVGPHEGDSLDAYPKERDSFWQMLVDNRVSAYLAGHEHLYNKSVRNGIPQLIIGTSGSSIYGGYGGAFYHYAIFRPTPDQGLLVTIYDETGKERDKITLKAGQ